MTLSDRMARAEDYVFGLMNDEERARAERDMEIDPQFRECVMVLAEQLRRLREEKEKPVSITDDAWRDITRRIASMPQMVGAATAERMGLSLGGDPSRKGLLRLNRPLAHHFIGWKATVMSVALIAALGMGYMVGEQSARLPTPVATAILEDAEGKPAVFVEAWDDRSVRLVPLGKVALPEGKMLQFWIDGKPYGVMPASLEALVRGPELPEPRAGQSYEVTIEDLPGLGGEPAEVPLFRGVAQPIDR